jgi:hypothetical protein
MALSVSHPVLTLDQYHPWSFSLGLIRDVIQKEPYNILYVMSIIIIRKEINIKKLIINKVI